MRIFENRDMASAFVAGMIEGCLAARLQREERCTLVLSGGTTPVKTFNLLAGADLPWSRVDVTLTDERQVPAEHRESNERLVREHLFRGPAADARFHSPTPENLANLNPFAFTLVGMGPDGHFASIFPDSPQLSDALNSTELSVSVTTPSSPFARVSMTLEALSLSDGVVLLVFGDDKKRILEAPADYPVQKLLNRMPVIIVWAP